MGQVTHQKSYSKVYRTWIAMLSRCRDENNNNYVNYGGRGITVCDEWYKFENFYRDMGDLPFYEAQLDRIDNEKGYYKENCRWVTCKENSRNRRNTKRITTHFGSLVQADLMERIGWNKNQFRWFLKRYGINWILDGFKNETLPERTNFEINRSDIVGQSFGDWKVLSFKSYTKKTGHIYTCECKCRVQRDIPRNNLQRGKTTSCRSCSAKKSWELKKLPKP
jgi:hypothetical protein